ncbi:serine/Arginine-related protein 53 [Notamacropus eugenii]|uniref:serine/Arginine-related protein 53 n=1 Tax=Notamacropus eugenii TaxID=9315 RepID=UPI003B67D9C0
MWNIDCTGSVDLGSWTLPPMSETHHPARGPPPPAEKAWTLAGQKGSPGPLANTSCNRAAGAGQGGSLRGGPSPGWLPPSPGRRPHHRSPKAYPFWTGIGTQVQRTSRTKALAHSEGRGRRRRADPRYRHSAWPLARLHRCARHLGCLCLATAPEGAELELRWIRGRGSGVGGGGASELRLRLRLRLLGAVLSADEEAWDPRARSRSRPRPRSHSRSSERSSHRRTRSRSRERDRRKGREKEKREKERERGKEKELYSTKRGDSGNIKAGLEHLPPAEQAKARLQLVLEAAAKADEALKAKERGEEEAKSRKAEDQATLGEQVKRVKEIEAIESDCFVQQTFRSSKEVRKPADPVEGKQEPTTSGPVAADPPHTEKEIDPSSIPTAIKYQDDNSLAHPNLFIEKAEAEEKWFKRLIALRQERLMGSPVA